MKTLVTFGLGALAMYLFDPQQGTGPAQPVRDQLAHASRFVCAPRRRRRRDLSYRQYAHPTPGLAQSAAAPAPARRAPSIWGASWAAAAAGRGA